MLTVSRSLLKRLRIVFTRGLGLTPRRKHPPVLFQPHAEGGLAVCIRGYDAAVSYHNPDIAVDGSFAVPFELLKQCEGPKNELLSLRREDSEVVAEWNEAAIPQVASFPVETADELPPLPTSMQTNLPELLFALRDAIDTADSQAVRYAMNCLRLRGGDDGQIAATDGQHLLVQGGFSFPWQGDALVPASRVFACADVSTDNPWEVGRHEDWVALRSSPWTIQLKIETEARFPRVDDFLPQPGSAATTLHVSESDAEFFTQSVKGLPANDEQYTPVTVDLNGDVTVRAKGADQDVPTELVLTDSIRDGAPIVFNSNREYLARAFQLGFRSVELFGAESPVCCREGQRSYVWALLGADGALKSDPNAVRIESPGGPATSGKSSSSPSSSTRKRRTRNTMPRQTQSNGHAQRNDTNSDENNGTTSLIDQAESLRNTLQDAVSETRELISALKKQKKQSKLMKSTLASLRQLQNVDV